jgi:hypothetical protein
VGPRKALLLSFINIDFALIIRAADRIADGARIFSEKEGQEMKGRKAVKDKITIYEKPT